MIAKLREHKKNGTVAFGEHLCLPNKSTISMTNAEWLKLYRSF